MSFRLLEAPPRPGGLAIDSPVRNVELYGPQFVNHLAYWTGVYDAAVETGNLFKIDLAGEVRYSLSLYNEALEVYADPARLRRLTEAQRQRTDRFLLGALALSRLVQTRAFAPAPGTLLVVRDPNFGRSYDRGNAAEPRVHCPPDLMPPAKEIPVLPGADQPHDVWYRNKTGLLLHRTFPADPTPFHIDEVLATGRAQFDFGQTTFTAYLPARAE